jgi:acyl-CoA thioester hydrolase
MAIWPHRFPVRVYFEDTDAGGIVYHANYLRWAERGRTESLRAMDLPHQLMIQLHASLLVVRRLEVEYVAPARLDDSLVVETRVLALRGASVDLDQRVLDAASGSERARLKVGLVCVRSETMRPAPIPEPWRGALRDGMM